MLYYGLALIGATYMDASGTETIQAATLSKDNTLLLVIDGKTAYFRITQSALVALLTSAISHVVTQGGNKNGQSRAG